MVIQLGGRGLPSRSLQYSVSSFWPVSTRWPTRTSTRMPTPRSSWSCRLRRPAPSSMARSPRARLSMAWTKPAASARTVTVGGRSPTRSKRRVGLPSQNAVTLSSRSALALPVGYYVMLKITRHLRRLNIHIYPVTLSTLHLTKPRHEKHE